jgi:hypothetical protein
VRASAVFIGSRGETGWPSGGADRPHMGPTREPSPPSIVG